MKAVGWPGREALARRAQQRNAQRCNRVAQICAPFPREGRKLRLNPR